MSKPSLKEIQRQFRLLDQSLTMHSILRDRYALRSLIIDLVQLAAAVIFCATTFMDDKIPASFGIDPGKPKILLGVASIAAFFASLFSLRVKWPDLAAIHDEASKKITNAMAIFRGHRKEDGTWPEDCLEELNKVYWIVSDNTPKIPDNKFVALKAKHLAKVELSKSISDHPGCPIWVLKIILFCRSITVAIFQGKSKKSIQSE